MAYLIPKQTIHFWTGQFSNLDPKKLPDYFVFFHPGNHRWRFESLQDWLHRHNVPRKGRVVPNVSPDSGPDTGHR
jgi:hypothetical protein